MNLVKIFLTAMIFVGFSNTGFATEKVSKKKVTKKIVKVEASKVKGAASKKATKSILSADKKEHNFDGIDIDGAVKAPNGFMIKGRTPQELQQMVDLRSNFRNNLRNSVFGVRSLAK